MYDVLIVGLGAAGYSAAIYTARYKLNTFLVGMEEGGLGITAAEVGNWPGDMEIQGPELMEKFKKHALSFQEVTHKVARVETIEPVKTPSGPMGQGFKAVLGSGETVEAKAVILATGSTKRHLNVPGEKEFAGKGVSYCATCDGFFYRNKTVAVAGGGDAAVEGAAIVAQVAKHVYLIHRRKEFRAEPYWVDRVRARENVTFVLERNVKEIHGAGKVTGITLDRPFEGKDTLDVDGIFIEIGSDPASALGKGLGAEADGKGFLKVDGAMRTTVKGVFA
ncbi:MAG: FAD-dependent oxidoreductase, partial [Patescibacteria group bacterium]